MQVSDSIDLTRKPFYFSIAVYTFCRQAILMFIFLHFALNHFYLRICLKGPQFMFLLTWSAIFLSQRNFFNI